MFQASTATSPLASSATTTIYVTAGEKNTTLYSQTCSGQVCDLTYTLYLFVPASALNTEMSQQFYPYFNVNLSTAASAAVPTVMLLGDGNPRVGKPQRISATEFAVIVTFTFTVQAGDNSYRALVGACEKATEQEDGIGLPGHHECGNKSVTDVPLTPLYYASLS